MIWSLCGKQGINLVRFSALDSTFNDLKLLSWVAKMEKKQIVIRSLCLQDFASAHRPARHSVGKAADVVYCPKMTWSTAWSLSVFQKVTGEMVRHRWKTFHESVLKRRCNGFTGMLQEREYDILEEFRYRRQSFISPASPLHIIDSFQIERKSAVFKDSEKVFRPKFQLIQTLPW